ncbi:hypothetical protein Q4567_00140 [Aliiglaciecola sp. 2_MG-2023]|uniref:hypothetical protein n=1 Tax=unclassified Aliiglaciecola TaxID=2593648 RepID=UPI0026E264D8|nr:MULTISPECIES: hypothetical protein [unclassified Aliiglaciecola]MDO6709116.1 hypothetical protein [Aliiglaciecola sp. 2_MG-2023]MDO6750264.1 hypothetical protein [Aliiglaciecola sp. 1_MG-2023]
MSNTNKEKREAILVSQGVIDKLKIKRNEITVQLEELKAIRQGVVEELKIERDKISNLRSALIK